MPKTPTTPSHPPAELGLSSEDARLVDALLLSRQQSADVAGRIGSLGAAPQAASGADNARQAKVAQLFGLMDHWQAPAPADDLVARTMQRVQAQRSRQQIAHTARALAAAPAAFRWPELIAVAATLMIAVSIMWPTLEGARSGARRVAAAANLGAGEAVLHLPTGESRQLAPHAGPVTASSGFWDAGDADRQSSGLFRLPQDEYLSLPDTARQGPKQPGAAMRLSDLVRPVMDPAANKPCLIFGPLFEAMGMSSPCGSGVCPTDASAKRPLSQTQPTPKSAKSAAPHATTAPQHLVNPLLDQTQTWLAPGIPQAAAQPLPVED